MTDAIRPNQALRAPTPTGLVEQPATEAPAVPGVRSSYAPQSTPAASGLFAVQASTTSWSQMRSRITDASIGIRADLATVLDTIDPKHPGEAFPLSHGEVYDVANLRAGRLVLRPENLAIGHVKSDPKTTSLVASYTDVLTNEVLGYVIRCFNVPERWCQRKYVMFQVNDPRTKGIGMRVASAWDAFVPLLGIEHTTIEAAYVGRLVWALEGFDFDNDTTRSAVKLNFARFMSRYDLHPDDLYFRRNDGSTEPFSFDKLHFPWDFAHVVWKVGTIRLPTRTTDSKDDEGVLDAGRAFMLGDFRRPELAQCVCPDYFGQRPTDPQAPGQVQARAYSGARLDRAR